MDECFHMKEIIRSSNHKDPLEDVHEKQTDYEPYGFIQKRVWVFSKANFLTYEGESLSIMLSSDNKQAEEIVHLLNCAFKEGYYYRAMNHHCDEDRRGEKLLTFQK